MYPFTLSPRQLPQHSKALRGRTKHTAIVRANVLPGSFIRPTQIAPPGTVQLSTPGQSTQPLFVLTIPKLSKIKR